MTGALTGPPARAVDVRVADSPLVGIRFHLDARMGDLMHALEAVDRERLETLELRSGLLQRMRRNEEARTALLSSLPRQSLLAVRRCLREGVETAAELGRVDEHLRVVSRMRSTLIQQSRALREVVSGITEQGEGLEVELSGRASRFSRATRRVFQLVDEQHAAVENALVEGPLQRLSEAVFDAEVAYRESGEHPEAAAERAARCHAATVEARVEFARLIRRWRPLHDDITLVEALRELFADVAPSGAVHLLLFGAERRLPAHVELAAFRIVENAVENAVRHARPQRVEVVLAFHRGRLAIVVKDDGDGFDVVATEARLGRSPGLGLISMRSRAALEGGHLDVRSVIGEGAEVRATLPTVEM